MEDMRKPFNYINKIWILGEQSGRRDPLGARLNTGVWVVQLGERRKWQMSGISDVRGKILRQDQLYRLEEEVEAVMGRRRVDVSCAFEG